MRCLCGFCLLVGLSDWWVVRLVVYVSAGLFGCWFDCLLGWCLFCCLLFVWLLVCFVGSFVGLSFCSCIRLSVCLFVGLVA